MSACYRRHADLRFLFRVIGHEQVFAAAITMQSRRNSIATMLAHQVYSIPFQAGYIPF
jgi:hypothetical protein